MKGLKERQYNRVRTLLFLILLLLINRIGASFPLRIDLTARKIHTLSPVSRDLIRNLEEPLTLRFFLSENLPGPYSSLNREIRDLMESYSLVDDRYFRYDIHRISGSQDPLEKTAADFGLKSVSLQDIQEDELTLINAWMGLVILQGERQLTIPVLETGGSLEYKITSAIKKLTRQSSQLFSLEEDIQIQLSLSSALFNLDEGLRAYPFLLEKGINDINPAYFNRLRFESEINEGAALQATLTLLAKGRSYKKNLVSLENGDFQISDPGELLTLIEEALPLLLGKEQRIAYLTDHGTKALYGEDGLNNFSRLVSEYTEIRPVTLEAGRPLPQDAPVLVIAGATTPFSPGELQILDRYIREGGSLALFHDSHKTILPTEEERLAGKVPEYIPLSTGLSGLMKSYGLEMSSAYVLDSNCYREILREEDGSLTEIPVYYALEIQKDEINRKNPAMRNLQGLIALNSSPLAVSAETEDGSFTTLFSSTEDSWLMKENINLYNPLALIPPSPGERASYPLAVLREGTEGSIFLTGSSAYLEDSLIDPEGVTPNAMMVLNILDLLSGREDNAALRAKGLSYNPLDESTRFSRGVFKGFNLIILPLVVIFTAISGIFRRKKRAQRIRGLFNGEGPP